MDLDKAEPLKQECRHFLDCIAQRRTPLSDGCEGLRVLRVLDACRQSLAHGKASVPRLTEAPKTVAYTAHDSAYLDQPCSIGKGTKIWHFSHIMQGATIGENCSIGQNVVVASQAVIGNGVKIQNNVSIYDAVTLEDDVFCGPSMVFTNVINPRSEIVRKNQYQSTRIKQGATLGTTRQSSADAPSDGTPWWLPGRSSPGTCPTTPWWPASPPDRSAGFAAVRPNASTSAAEPARVARPVERSTKWKMGGSDLQSKRRILPGECGE